MNRADITTNRVLAPFFAGYKATQLSTVLSQMNFTMSLAYSPTLSIHGLTCTVSSAGQLKNK